MATYRRMSDSDKEFARAAWPGVSASKIAAKLGFSKTAIVKFLKREGLWELRDEPGNFEPATLADESERQDTAGRLRELRDALKLALVDADPKTIPAVAREYRATLEAIDELEGGGGDDAGSALAAIFRSVSSHMPS